MHVQQLRQLFSLPETTSRIFLELLEHGEVSPRQLSARLSISRPSVYDHLERLEELGLVTEREVNGRAKMSPLDRTALAKKLSEQQAAQEQAAKSLLDFAANQTKATHADARIKFHEGTKALQTALHDMLWYTKSEVSALWPYEVMRETLGDDFLQSFNKKRIRQGVQMKILWTGPCPKNHLFTGNDTGITRRTSPRTKVAMSYTIYEDKVLFISSKKESFGYTITSHDHSELMRAQFETLWQDAKKITPA